MYHRHSHVHKNHFFSKSFHGIKISSYKGSWMGAPRYTTTQLKFLIVLGMQFWSSNSNYRPRNNPQTCRQKSLMNTWKTILTPTMNYTIWTTTSLLPYYDKHWMARRDILHPPQTNILLNPSHQQLQQSGFRVYAQQPHKRSPKHMKPPESFEPRRGEKDGGGEDGV